MKTFEQFSKKPESILTLTSMYLADLGEAKGKQELFTKQAPQKLKVLREHALIESAVSSSRIEGVEVEQSRIGTLIFGKPVLQDRDEEEVRGYRDALEMIHRKREGVPMGEATVKHLHELVKSNDWDAGNYKEKPSNIIEKYPDGRERVRFRAVSPTDTADYMRRSVDLWNRCIKERWIHSLIALAGFNLDFLCIHPFRDGNGRVSRLLLLLQCYHLGYEVGRYISLERLIEQNKQRYYETLELSSQGWHDGKHDPWPYVNFLLYILKTAYGEFEERLGQIKSPRGAKTELIIGAIERADGRFTVSGIQAECPGVSVDMIRKVLKDLRSKGLVECLGRGQNAQWEKSDPSLSEARQATGN
jgi:Fic family protein